MSNKTIEMLGDKAEELLSFECKGIPKESIYVPGPDFIDRVWSQSDRSPQVLRSLQTFYKWPISQHRLRFYFAGRPGY